MDELLPGRVHDARGAKAVAGLALPVPSYTRVIQGLYRAYIGVI